MAAVSFIASRQATQLPRRDPRQAGGLVKTSTLLGVVAAAGLGRLGPALVPRFSHDRRDLRVGDEALPAFRVPVEEHPDPILFVRIAEDGGALGPVLAPLVGARGREDLREAVEIFDLRRCEDHWISSCVLPASPLDADGA